MGLTADMFFCHALRSDAALMGRLAAGDVYSTAIGGTEDEADNAAPPYVVVSLDGMANDAGTKDGPEGETDSVSVGIEIAARDREELAELAVLVRRAVERYFLEGKDADAPLDYGLRADGVLYDYWKPCHWQVLHYDCCTLRD